MQKNPKNLSLAKAPAYGRSPRIRSRAGSALLGPGGGRSTRSIPCGRCAQTHAPLNPPGPAMLGAFEARTSKQHGLDWWCRSHRLGLGIVWFFQDQRILPPPTPSTQPSAQATKALRFSATAERSEAGVPFSACRIKRIRGSVCLSGACAKPPLPFELKL